MDSEHCNRNYLFSDNREPISTYHLYIFSFILYISGSTIPSNFLNLIFYYIHNNTSALLH